MDPRATGRIEDCASPSELITAIEKCPHTCVEVSRKTYLMICALRGETVLHSYAQTFVVYPVDLRQEIPLWKELTSIAVAKSLKR